MSLIRDLADIVSESEKQYKKLLADGHSAVYKRELAYANDDSAHAAGRIYHCDNLQLLSDGIREGWLREGLDMIYCDPPFFTRTKQETNIKIYNIPEDGKKPESVKLRQRAYSDMWNGNINDYLRMIAVRLYFMRDALKPEGSIFIHLDWHAVHAVKLIMDEIFGEKNFVNEIIWTYKSGGAAKRHFSRKHDTILFYGKTSEYIFNEQEKEKSYNRGLRPYHFKGVQEFKDSNGWYTLVKPRDVWQIDMVGRSSAERLNYATQKPEALLERIIRAVTAPGALCADFFCGSGTLAAAAAGLGRRFICADAGELAVSNSIKRLILNKKTFELWSASGAEEQPDRSFSESEEGLPLRPSDMQRGMALLAADPEAFNDFTLKGRLDSTGCMHPEGACMRTEAGIRQLDLTSEGAQSSDRRAELVFDVFGRRTLRLDEPGI